MIHLRICNADILAAVLGQEMGLCGFHYGPIKARGRCINKEKNATIRVPSLRPFTNSINFCDCDGKSARTICPFVIFITYICRHTINYNLYWH